jgi:hypothetical protein
MKKQSKPVSSRGSASKKPYVAAKVTKVQIDHEISLVMSSESPMPPPEFIRLMF